MLRLAIFCGVCLCFVSANELEDNCIMEFLKQRKLVNYTKLNSVYYKRKNCDQIVKKFVKTIYEKNFDYLEEDAAVDNKTYRNCLKTEFDRHKMDEKFLKAKSLDYEPQKTKLENIRDAVLTNIKTFCSKSFAQVASERFKEFVSDEGGPKLKASRHPAFLKIKDNLVCLNLYAVEKDLLDPSYYHLDLKLINQTDEDCKQAVDDVKELIMDEWHIRRASEDDEINRCLIEIFLETQAPDLFIKKALLSQMQLSQEHKDFEREDFIKSSSIVHEMSYKCMSIGFEKI